MWIIYRAVAINDVHPDFSSIQNFIHSVMISPSSYEITDQHAFLPPWLTVWKALNVFWRGGVSDDAYIDLALSAAFIGLFVLSWRYLRASYRVYCVAILLISLSFYAARHQSTPRLAASLGAGVSSLHRTGGTIPAANLSVAADRAGCMPVGAIAVFRVAVVDSLRPSSDSRSAEDDRVIIFVNHFPTVVVVSHQVREGCIGRYQDGPDGVTIE